MKPDPKAEGLRWLRQAERDLDDAEYSLTGRRYNLACANLDDDFRALKPKAAPLDHYYVAKETT